MVKPDAKEAGLRQLQEEVAACRGCALGETRTNPVFGDGNAQARLIFVGEAPGYHEDQQGIPFVGRAGQLLAQLLGRIGLGRADVYIANVLKCRPPDNRDPQAEEINCCRSFLERQIQIIDPLVVCTLGNFSTKLLTGRPDGISRIHGRGQAYPGRESTRIYPVFHPAAALYTPSNLKELEADFDRLPQLLGMSDHKPKVEAVDAKTEFAVELTEAQADPEQLGLF